VLTHAPRQTQARLIFDVRQKTMTPLDTAKISTMEEFAAFIDQVRADFSAHGDRWENPDLPRFLEALQAWLRDSDGYYKNQKIDISSVKPWRQIADAIAAARIYE
jgi:hypothetical protein